MAERSFFTEYKKGEINDLRLLLQDTFAKRNEIKQRNVVRKVIACMTLGMDVSPLFSDMIMAANTKDLVQKKLVYLYLTHYSREQANLALLVINTFQKDCRDDSPMIRGLALRALTGLRIPSLIEYVMQPLKNGLVDVSPYVRKTAAISCAKTFSVIPTAIKEPGIVNRLYEMIRDKDPLVVSNAVVALNEILAAEGGIQVTQPMVLHLLDMFRLFNEWSQCAILEILLKYEPTEEEVFPFMNVLDEKLRHPNNALVLAVIKLFLKYTENMPDIHQQVYFRVKEPLLTLMAGATSEQELVVLCHVRLLLERCVDAFADDYRRFFCRQNDPIYLKMVKIDVLQEVATAHSAPEIIAELREYVLDLNQKVSRRGSTAIARIALRVPASVDTVTQICIQLVDYGIPQIADLTLICLRDILRKYPELSEQIIPELQKCFGVVSSSEGKAALIWMVGEYGDRIEESPYLLEDLVDGWSDEDPAVRLQLLSASAKLFFKRPGEMQPTIISVLEKGVDDDANPDVHDRALFLTRLIGRDANLAKSVIDNLQDPTQLFEDDAAPEIKDRLFEEFNTLSIVYGEPAERFIKIIEEKLVPTPVHTAAPALQPSVVPAARPQQPPAQPPSGISLKPNPQLNAKAYESTWKALDVLDQLEVSAILPTQNPKALEQTFQQHNLSAVASGIIPNQNVLKMYLYGQEDPSNEFVFVELMANLNTNVLTAKVKSTDDTVGKQFATLFRNIIQQLLN